jgi:hypothetical protein
MKKIGSFALGVCMLILQDQGYTAAPGNGSMGEKEVAGQHQNIFLCFAGSTQATIGLRFCNRRPLAAGSQERPRKRLLSSA